jgi:hypothetical protein
MSDYLSRAIERARDGSGSVRPQLPSFFDTEKASDAFAPPNMERHSEVRVGKDVREGIGDQISVTNERSVATNASGVDVSAEEIPSAGPEQRTHERFEPAAKKRAAKAEEPAVGVAASARSRAVPVKLSPALEKPIELSESESLNQTRLAERSVIESVAASASKRMIPPQIVPNAKSTLRSPGMAQPVTRPKSDLRTPIIAQPITQTEAPAAQAKSFVSSNARFVPRESSPADSRRRNGRISHPDNDSAVTRSIHVTIGRVEIRAVPPLGLTPPRPPSPSPKKSLDDYLRSRKGSDA